MTRRYPAYRDSGVEWLGEVPEGWGIGPVKAVATCNDEVLTEDTDPEWEIEYLEISGVDAFMGITETSKVAFGGAASRARRRVKDGDILVSTVRTYLRAIAQVIEPPTNMIASTGFAVLRPRSVGSRFLGYLFRSEILIGKIIARSVGVSYPAINASDIMSLPIPIPPLPEQTAIAAFLDRETAKIDGLVAEQRRLIVLLREKRQAAISHTVNKGLNPHAPLKPSGIDWLGDVPEGWEVKPLKRLTPEITVGIVVEPSKYYAEEGVPALRSLNIKPGQIVGENLVFISAEANELLKKSQLNEGDLVAVRTGQPGTCSVVGPDYAGCNCIDLIIVRKPSTTDSHFLRWYLTSDVAVRQFTEGSGGAIQQHFNVGMAVELIIVVPPVEEQLRIVAFLEKQTAKLDTLTTTAESAIALLQERRAALISAAVTGKIDVRHLAPQETEYA